MSYALKGSRERLGEITTRTNEFLGRGLNQLTATEKEEFNRLLAEEGKLKGDVDRLDGEYEATAQSLLSGNRTAKLTGPTPQWATLDGRPVNVLAKHERFTKFNAKPAVPLGDMIRTAITGRGSAAVKAALGEDQNASGGFLVPTETGRQLIDLARAKSVLVQAGAQTVEMETDSLTIARVKTDPTMQVKEENAAFSEASIVFEAVGFTAHTIGCLIYASRELAEDAVNFGPQVEGVITAALGAELDRLGLVGSGSQEPLGIAN